MKKIHTKEFISKQLVQNPGRILIAAILLFNLLFFAAAAVIISRLAPPEVAGQGFWACVFYTISMILDAGCVQYIVTNINEVNVAVVVICLVVIIIGMITFTGAVIGYLTNYISGFIERANSGSTKLVCSDHTIILNWNTRASEMINDMLYNKQKEYVVVLVDSGKEEIEKEIENRISETIEAELEENKNLSKRAQFRLARKLRKNVTVVIREGNIFSSKQLNDISIKSAKAVIILESDIQNTVCRFDHAERQEAKEKGNSLTIKTLIQVAEFTSADDSFDDQKIIVEVNDEWTLYLVEKIIEQKEKIAKCNIIPVSVNRILGQILSQFTVMPELNIVYKTLLSNKGAAFYYKDSIGETNNSFGNVEKYMKDHRRAIMLTTMKTKTGNMDFYMAGVESDIDVVSKAEKTDLKVSLQKDFWLEKRNIIILGHNSNSTSIMNGFDSFSGEWDFHTDELREKFGHRVLDILVIDDKKSLEKLDYYKQYDYVTDAVAAEIYDREKIYETICNYIDSHSGDVSILVLSDDSVLSEDTDANVLTYLVYIRDIVRAYQQKDKNFNEKSIDVVAEIIDPKNYAVISNYNVKNIVISNRYISKLMTQIGEKEALFEFYNDILAYDSDDGSDSYESREIYVKKAARFFKELPPKCKASELVRAVYDAEPDIAKKSVLLGYVRDETEMVIFCDDYADTEVELCDRDKVILYTAH